MRRLILVAGLAVLSLTAGCEGGLQDGAAAQAPAPQEGIVVDSIFPMPEMMSRFQAAVPRRPADLGDDAPRSRSELVDRFVEAVQDSSAEALAALRLDVSEFAFLYFPSSRFARPPLAQPPQTSWLLVEQNGMKGEARLLRRFGGRPLAVRETVCEYEPAIEGENRLWERCSLVLGDGSSMRLFGSIIERDGRYRFVSIANQL
jgi:hypothetical protein